MIEKNDKAVYDCFKKNFPVDCGSPYLNLSPIPIYDSFIPNKISCCTPDMLPSDISIYSKRYVSTFTTPSESPQVILLNPYASNTDHIIMRDKPSHATDKMGYCSSLHYGIRLYKNPSYISPLVLFIIFLLLLCTSQI